MGNPLGAIFVFIGGMIAWASIDIARVDHTSETGAIVMGVLILLFGLYIIFSKN